MLSWNWPSIISLLDVRSTKTGDLCLSDKAVAVIDRKSGYTIACLYVTLLRLYQGHLGVWCRLQRKLHIKFVTSLNFICIGCVVCNSGLFLKNSIIALPPIIPPLLYKLSLLHKLDHLMTFRREVSLSRQDRPSLKAVRSQCLLVWRADHRCPCPHSGACHAISTLKWPSWRGKAARIVC